MATTKTKSYKTKKQTGLAIARDGNTFTCTWKLGDTYFAQTYDYKIGNGAWTNEVIGDKTTKKAFTVTASNYYPTTGTKLTSVAFRLTGVRATFSKGNTVYKTKFSNTVSKVFTINPPAAPKLSVARDANTNCAATFSWTYPGNSSQWATTTEWETRLIKDCDTTDAAKAWKMSYASRATGSGSLSGTKYYDDSATVTGYSYTRWFRIRAKGLAGDSGWSYSRILYAAPNQANNVKASVTRGTSSMNVTVSWNVPTSPKRLCDKVTVKYAIDTPLADLACPASPSWQDGNAATNHGGADKVNFTIGSALTDDQCLFIRVDAEYADFSTVGTPIMALRGGLSVPSGLSVTTDSTTYQATVTATNNSAVPDSFLVVQYSSESSPKPMPVAVIPHGSTTVSNIQCPAWGTSEAVQFSVYACQGSYTATTRADGVSSYAIKRNLWSYTVTDGGAVPVAPSGVSLAMTDTPGTIQVTFNWSWDDATSAEISWADHEDAWYSTDEPETYTIDSIHASRWNISGLDCGVTWYVRVRLISGTGDNAVYGAYSDIQSIDLSSAPAVPALSLSAGVVTEDGQFTASWSYASTDGTQQAYAEVASVSSGVYTEIGHAETAQHVDIPVEELGWSTGTAYDLAVRVTSASGNVSDWSDTVSITVASPLTASIDSDSTTTQTITTDGTTRTVNALTAMPMTVTVLGAGVGNTTTVAIERAETYHVERPDESEMYGYEGETVALISQVGEDAISITTDDLIGRLDDGARYRIVATVSDGLGQSATATKDFEVHWSHQAEAPTATVVIDSDTQVAQLTPIAPAGYVSGDVCDIYRLSVDKPVLIYPGAAFGTTYVDPYPTIGEHGGHRFVTRTANGDYIDADNAMAWYDSDTELDVDYNIIEFGTGRIELLYEIDLSNSWKKDFTETQYLGGSVQGDWNPAVSRSTSVSGVGVTADDTELIESMRRLAVWPGICHVRTKDGSSFAADVQVKEDYKQADNQKIVYFSLTITRVDSDGYDGMTLAEWEELQEE